MTSTPGDVDTVPAVQHTVGSVVGAAASALRPKQWFKNVPFLFAALVFSREFTHLHSVKLAMLGFAAFCLVSSGGYVLNDYLDREADRRHPSKRKRPIASGALPLPIALVELVLVFGAGVAIAWFLSPAFLLIALLYLCTTLSYSFFFKHLVILDVMFLSAGFVWRAIAGAVAIGVSVSPWLFVCTAFLALFLGFHKRRAELVHIGTDLQTRKNLAEYSPQMLDQFQAIVTGNVVVSYSLYSILGPTPWMAITLPYVLYGIFRYIYLVDQRGEGGSPTDTVLGDVPIVVTGLLFAITAALVLLFAPAKAVAHF